MALQQINGNQISTSTQALITSLQFLNTNSVLQLPTGTTAQRPTGVAYGTLRFNTTEDKVEVYVSNSNGQGLDGWTLVGAGGPHVGNKDTSYIRTNSNSIDENITIGPVANGGAQYTNAYAAGPVEIASGYTLTIENGANFYVIGEDTNVAAYEDLDVYDILNTVGARFDVGAIRERVVSYRLPDFDTSPVINIDYLDGAIVYVTNLQNNFMINLRGVPQTSIGTGGVDSNRAFGFTIVYQNGSTAYRPSGTIMLDGNSIGTARWLGGSAPTATANRTAVIGVSLLRVTQYTDSSGGTSNSWIPLLQMNEFA